MENGELFEDPMFERSPTVAGYEVTWSRPSDLCDDPKLVVDGMDRSGLDNFFLVMAYFYDLVPGLM